MATLLSHIEHITKICEQNWSKNKKIPIPGIEPGPPGWKPGILTTRPNGIRYPQQFLAFICRQSNINFHTVYPMENFNESPNADYARNYIFLMKLCNLANLILLKFYLKHKNYMLSSINQLNKLQYTASWFLYNTPTMCRPFLPKETNVDCIATHLTL